MRLLDRIANALLCLLGVVLILMVLLTVYNVISRYVFNRALLWGDEVAVYAMIVLAWLGAVVCSWRNAEIRMDILVNLGGPRSQRAIHAFQQAAMALLCAWVAWQAMPYVVRAWRIGMRSDAAGLPLWLLHAVIPFSLAVIALVSTVHCLRLIVGQPMGSGPEAATASEVPKGQAG